MTGRRGVGLKMVGRGEWAGLKNEGRGLKMGGAGSQKMGSGVPKIGGRGLQRGRG